MAFEVPRKSFADHKLPLQSGRQAISFSEAWRQVPVIFAVPTPKFVAVMTGEAVAAMIVIVVIFSMSTFIPPVSVVVPSIVIAPVIFVVLVFVSKSCVSGKHKKAENNDRKTFLSIQRFPPT
jgi:hypothetical protein